MVKTAKEFYDEHYSDDTVVIMKDYAKFHVEAALKSASENAYVEYIDLDTNEIFDYTDVITDNNVGADVNKKSILNAYPIENIK